MGIKQKLIRGFTIIELLIVVAIVGILAGVTAIIYSGVQSGARDTSVLSDVDTMDGLQTSYGLKNDGAPKPYYSGNGPDSELDFAPSGDNVIDVVTSGDDYCIRGYNPKSLTYKTLTSAAIKESTPGICATLTASTQAINDAPNTFTSVSWTPQTAAGSKEWTADVASSADGMTLVAANGNSGLVTSNDGGLNWTQRFPEDYTKSWIGFAASSDGTKLFATTFDVGGYVYGSTDSGATWTPLSTGSGQGWSWIASSSDGNKLAAVGKGSGAGYLYTSTDSGVTWTQQTAAGSQNWVALDSSSDGTKLVASIRSGGYGTPGYIYTSTDSGATWTQRTSAGNRIWLGVASSSDGTKLVASADYIYTSTDSGATWTQRTSAGNRSWFPVASSADGTKLVAGVDGISQDYLYTSTDSGATWTQQTDTTPRYWFGIATSSDGSKIFASVEMGYLYRGVYY